MIDLSNRPGIEAQAFIIIRRVALPIVAFALFPGPTGILMGHMLHGNLEDFSWTLTWGGFFMGLVSWVLTAAAAGWLVGWFYNRLGGSSES